MCQGQLLPIAQFTAMFSLIGTFYGGNGTTNFQLPDLRSRVPIKYGTDPTGNNYAIGEEAGTETITISANQMPVHTHTFSGTNLNSGHARPADGASLGTNPQGTFFYGASNASLTTINAGTLSTFTGGNQPHTNIQPYQVLNWCIASQGIFPSRN